MVVVTASEVNGAKAIGGEEALLLTGIVLNSSVNLMLSFNE